MKAHGDPKVMKAKFSGKCAAMRCNTKIKKGELMYYWPKARKAYCESCGHADYASFLESKQDEFFYQSLY